MLYALIAQARQYPDTIILGRGDPDFDTPPHIVAAAHAAMKHHANDYSPPEGILPLRQAISERVRRTNGITVDPETEVVVTNGGQEALFLMVVATVAAGEELIIPEPNYNTYQDALRFAGGVKAVVRTDMGDDFRLHPDRVRRAIRPRTRALLMVSPNNPTAGVIAPGDAAELLAIAQEHDLIILADDIYDVFVYDQAVHTSVASLPGARERTLTLNALSKSFAMTGWRTGWVVGPAWLIAQVKQYKAAISGPSSIISQHAALAALTGPQDDIQRMHEVYTRRRRMVLDVLDSMGIRYGAPQGGQFVFADISFTGMDSGTLAERILTDQHVLCYPGSAFAEDWRYCLRITFLQPEDRLREGLERMKTAMANLNIADSRRAGALG
jgi:aminotransferase